jgi:hypothetical protein
MGKNGAESLHEMTREVAVELKELNRQLNSQANDVRKAVIKQLNTTAHDIRKEARAAGQDTEVWESASSLAKGLEKAAHYLGTRSIDEWGEETTRIVRRYPLKALLITFIVGALIGLALREDYRRQGER